MQKATKKFGSFKYNNYLCSALIGYRRNAGVRRRNVKRARWQARRGDESRGAFFFY